MSKGIVFSDEQYVEIINQAQILAGEEPDASLDNLENEEKTVGRNLVNAIINVMTDEQKIKLVNDLGLRVVEL